MNAGPDVERLISDWLIEEAPAHAPERVLDAAARTIDRTKQRRFGAAWREPMTISTARLAAAAVLILAAVAGAGWIGRATSTPSVGGPGEATPSVPAANPSSIQPAGSADLTTYRTARNAVCATASERAAPLKAQFDGLFDPALSDAERAGKIQAMRDVVELYGTLVLELRALDAPPDIHDEHVANVTRFEDLRALLAQVASRLDANQLVGAEALDQATEGITTQIEAFENRQRLQGCP